MGKGLRWRWKGKPTRCPGTQRKDTGHRGGKAGGQGTRQVWFIAGVGVIRAKHTGGGRPFAEIKIKKQNKKQSCECLFIAGEGGLRAGSSVVCGPHVHHRARRVVLGRTGLRLVSQDGELFAAPACAPQSAAWGVNFHFSHSVTGRKSLANVRTRAFGFDLQGLNELTFTPDRVKRVYNHLPPGRAGTQRRGHVPKGLEHNLSTDLNRGQRKRNAQCILSQWREKDGKQSEPN